MSSSSSKSSQARLREALTAGGPSTKEKGPPVADGVLSVTPDTAEAIEWHSRQSVVDRIAACSSFLDDDDGAWAAAAAAAGAPPAVAGSGWPQLRCTHDAAKGAACSQQREAAPAAKALARAHACRRRRRRSCLAAAQARRRLSCMASSRGGWTALARAASASFGPMSSKSGLSNGALLLPVHSGRGRVLPCALLALFSAGVAWQQLVNGSAACTLLLLDCLHLQTRALPPPPLHLLLLPARTAAARCHPPSPTTTRCSAPAPGRYLLVYPHGCDVANHLSLFLCVADYDKLLPGWSHFAQVRPPRGRRAAPLLLPPPLLLLLLPRGAAGGRARAGAGCRAHAAGCAAGRGRGVRAPAAL